MHIEDEGFGNISREASVDAPFGVCPIPHRRENLHCFGVRPRGSVIMCVMRYLMVYVCLILHDWSLSCDHGLEYEDE